MARSDYEMVAGLEIHAELKTKTKMYCACKTDFGAEPNTQICPVCLGLPGTLPVLNEKAIDFAVAAGLAMDCSIREISKQDRKNYYYPDLPKAYQISQYDLPLCYDGVVLIETPEGEKKIGITRIHIEEDAGKLLNEGITGTLIDYNRGGVPLIEIVSEPDLRSIEETKIYFETVKTILRYIGVSDCKMEEGSLRCDINVSVRRKGDPKLGTRCELKNMNSFTQAVRAMEYEMNRQIDLIESGEKVIQETRRFIPEKNRTESMRTKEESQDYRYFPEPDIMPIVVPRDKIEKIRNTLPELPKAKKEKYIKEYQLTEYDANLLTEYIKVATYFERAIQKVKTPKTVANMIISDFYSRFTKEEEKETFCVPIEAEDLGELVSLIEAGEISKNIAKNVLTKMWDTGKKAKEVIANEGLKSMDSDDELMQVVTKILDEQPQSVADYKAGRERAIKALMGGIMKETRGSANPEKVNKLLLDALSKR